MGDVYETNERVTSPTDYDIEEEKKKIKMIL